MKKIFIAAALIVSFLAPQVLVPAHSEAANVFGKPCNAHPNTSVCKEVKNGDRQNPFIRIIKAAINIVSILAGIAAVIGAMVSGLRMVMANGNADSVASARTGLMFSLVGVAVVVLAQVIVVFVLNRL